jgi:hypothetical protein
MSEVIGSEAQAVTSCTGESLGPWVNENVPVGKGLADADLFTLYTRQAAEQAWADEIADIRSQRAGKAGPLGSLACLSGVDDSWPRPAPAKPGAKAPVKDTVFIAPTKATAFALSSLMALGIVAGFGIQRDMAETDRLGALEQDEHRIAEHNYTRNLLIEHLAKGRGGKIAHLRGYAERLDELAAEPKSVVIFTPADPQAKAEAAALPELRRRIEKDIEQIESWTPPPLLKSHTDAQFTPAEFRDSRLPTGGMLAVVLAALIVWSALSLRNLPALRGAASFKPAWVPLCWLTPVANLYLPLVVMRDIWSGSDPVGLLRPEGLRLPVMGMWWLTFLGAVGMFGYAAFRMAAAAGIFMMNEAARFAMYADAGVLGLAAVTFVIVAAASWNQSRRIALVENMEAQIGPRGPWQRK